MAYATVNDLEARWRPLSDAEKPRAEVLLDDAAALIDTACPSLADRIADGDESASRAALMVSCSIVKRAMISPVDQAPMSQYQQTAGPFSQSGTFANPSGDLYLTKADKRLLGCGQQVAFTVPLIPEPEQ